MSNINELYGEVKKSLKGKDETVKKAVAVLAAGGHLLLEDIPGVGKTTLSKALAAAVGLDTKRIQFTPDTLPSDVTGFTMWDAEQKKFRFHSGAVMTNILLADEINRTSPRTQSALLQAMEEGCVTEEGEVYRLDTPFMVIATQNPIGSAGTMPLPQSQLDRFMMRLSLGRPDITQLKELLLDRSGCSDAVIDQVCSKSDICRIQQEVSQIYISENMAQWIAELIERTHTDDNISQGISPRGALSLMQAAKAAAYIESRDSVMPADAAWIFSDVCAHRLSLSPKAVSKGVKAESVCDEILKSCTPPHVRKGR